MVQDYFGPLCGVDKDFKYSNGWLNNFKKRYHITLQTIVGESGSVDKVKVEEDRKLLRKVLSKYIQSDIFNLDETALFFKLPPNKTLASKINKLEGVKQSKDRLSVAVIVNAPGDEFIKPIGHHRKPRCFKDTYWHNYIIENY